MIKIAITDDTNLMRPRLILKLIKLAGGDPVLIPQEIDLGEIDSSLTYEELCEKQKTILEQKRQDHLMDVRGILEGCHAIVLPGNRYDVPPSAYGEVEIHPTTTIQSKISNYRFKTECLMIEHALERKKPVLAICGGFQVVNVFMGGSLIQHLPDVVGHELHRDNVGATIDKSQEEEYENNFEDFILKGQGKQIFSSTQNFYLNDKHSIIHDFYAGRKEVGELNLHHQGMFETHLASGIRAVGVSDDQVVEAAVIKEHPFGVLFQPHIECNVGGIALKAFKALVKAAKG